MYKYPNRQLMVMAGKARKGSPGEEAVGEEKSDSVFFFFLSLFRRRHFPRRAFQANSCRCHLRLSAVATGVILIVIIITQRLVLEYIQINLYKSNGGVYGGTHCCINIIKCLTESCSSNERGLGRTHVTLHTL